MESNGKIMATKNIIYWCCPRPRPAIFHLASRGLHTASVKFASGDISAAQRTLAPVLNDDWSKPCCMSNNYKSNTMPPVQKYCHSYHDIPVLSSGKNERRHKKNWSATDCLPSIQYFHRHEPSSCKAGFLWSPRNSAGGGPRWFLAWRNGSSCVNHSTRQDVTPISTSIKTGLYSRHSCHRPSCRWP